MLLHLLPGRIKGSCATHPRSVADPDESPLFVRNRSRRYVIPRACVNMLCNCARWPASRTCGGLPLSLCHLCEDPAHRDRAWGQQGGATRWQLAGSANTSGWLLAAMRRHAAFRENGRWRASGITFLQWKRFHRAAVGGKFNTGGWRLKRQTPRVPTLSAGVRKHRLSVNNLQFRKTATNGS